MFLNFLLFDLLIFCLKLYSMLCRDTKLICPAKVLSFTVTSLQSAFYPVDIWLWHVLDTVRASVSVSVSMFVA